MKKVIKGKVYDTAKATQVASWSNNRSTSDFGYCSEELYRKRTGEFFLHGEGGPNSKYGCSVGNGEWGYGEQITPLTYEAASRWTEEHANEQYEAIFGEIEEDETKTTATIYLSVSTLEKAKRAAAQAGMSISAYIESLLQNLT